jgi:hypothetical protein
MPDNNALVAWLPITVFMMSTFAGDLMPFLQGEAIKLVVCDRGEVLARVDACCLRHGSGARMLFNQKAEKLKIIEEKWLRLP